MSGRLGYVAHRYLDAPAPDAEQVFQLRAILGLHLSPVTGESVVKRMPRRRTVVRRAAA